MQTKVSTPLMQQYYAIKAQHPNALILFQVGDFYETFEEDAHALHKVTDARLTKRSNGAAGNVALAGFPHHALNTYLPKLVKAGYRVAICDQMEVPQKGKTLVKREVTELVTPGLTYHDDLLEKKSNHYLASLHFGKQAIGIALLDISTGEFLTTQGNQAYISKIIQSFSPKEVLFNKKSKNSFHLLFPHSPPPYYIMEDKPYLSDYGYRKLTAHFGTSSLKGYGIDHLPEAIVSAGAILRYLETTQHKHLHHITRIAQLKKGHYMWLDKFTIRNLELLRPQQEEGVSLFQVLDHTHTPMGARKLRKWLLFPLTDLKAIQKRLDIVEMLVQAPDLIAYLSEELGQINDLARLISKVASKRINPRELQTLKKNLLHIVPIKEALAHSPFPPLHTLSEKLHPCTALVNLINQTLQEAPPVQINQGGLIKAGLDPQLDQLREMAMKGHRHLDEIQSQARKTTGISSLKIGYNKVFGYYLEVTHTHKSKVPPEWIRKQTLVNAERYITEELKQYEEMILHAQTHFEELEQKHYLQLVEKVVSFIAPIQQNANTLADIDCYHTFAYIANAYHYVRPTLDDGDTIHIEGGRHPVIERYIPLDQTYVPNDVLLSPEQQILLITGPNMAGKSALLRQVALIVLLAHVGAFVPADKARISLTDRLFTRVGAADNIAKQQSTFMVEMHEMANILHHLTPRSLVIVDELGRGTGTLDGTALATSILLYLHNHPQCQPKTLFATHYHELNALAAQLPKLKNYKVVVKETGEDIYFLHRLEPGSSQKSFGVHVAKMAGIPQPIIDSAQELIATATPALPPDQDILSPENIAKQLHLFKKQLTPKLDPIIQAINKIDIPSLAPVEALLKLAELQHLVAAHTQEEPPKPS